MPISVAFLTSAIPGALSPSQKRAAMRAVEVRRLDTLRRAGTLVEKLVHSFRNELEHVAEADPIFGRRPGSGPVVVTDALADFVPETTAALMTLSAQDREGVLQRDGEAFAVAAFAPMLETLARDGSAEAVRLLNVVAPARARPILLADLARTRPRWSADVSDSLADAALPAFDATFVRQLRSAATAAELREAMTRVSRFASAAIARDRAHRPNHAKRIGAAWRFTTPNVTRARTDPRRATPRHGTGCRGRRELGVGMARFTGGEASTAARAVSVALQEER